MPACSQPTICLHYDLSSTDASWEGSLVTWAGGSGAFWSALGLSGWPRKNNATSSNPLAIEFHSDLLAAYTEYVIGAQLCFWQGIGWPYWPDQAPCYEEDRQWGPRLDCAGAMWSSRGGQWSMVLKQVNILITGIKHRQRPLGGNLFCVCVHHCKMNARATMSLHIPWV